MLNRRPAALCSAPCCAHESASASCAAWQLNFTSLTMHRDLFMDGYDAKGDRIYDKVAGQTCHQCRQKTMGKRTCCSKCNSLSVRPPRSCASAKCSAHHCIAGQRVALQLLWQCCTPLMPCSCPAFPSACPRFLSSLPLHLPQRLNRRAYPYRACFAATACTCGTARTWTRPMPMRAGRAPTAATRCCATAASTATAAAGRPPARSTARLLPWVRAFTAAACQEQDHCSTQTRAPVESTCQHSHRRGSCVQRPSPVGSGAEPVTMCAAPTKWKLENQLLAALQIVRAPVDSASTCLAIRLQQTPLAAQGTSRWRTTWC